MRPELDLPDPFQPTHTNVNSPLRSIVDAPDEDNIVLRLPSTLIVIQEGNLLLRLVQVITFNLIYNFST